MRHVAIVCSLLTIILFNNGCAEKECIPVPQKCVVPYTQLPSIDNTLCDDNNYSCIAIKALTNYEAMKAYAETLLTNSQVCR